ncbi:MAG: SDR family NAD(P)-dependent oxidoreductase [Candidatus Wallbacteria bacterium]|nr:SDR family NAD(P)-dependent oxidoreductase [Candidatus Wallbacteria bacterium]
MISLAGKRVLVTGATSGIGEACARVFAEEWCALVLTGRREDRLQSLGRELAELHGIELTTIVLDVRDLEGIRAVPWPEIDLLINNAGLGLGLDPIQKGSIEEWDEMIDANIKGLLYVTRAILPGMVERGSGHVINLGSAAGHWVYPGGNVYCATKSAVKALTEAMRLDLAGAGIRVSSVDPGMVETEFSVIRFRGDAARAKSVYAGMTPLTAEDVADAILFCATRSPHVNINEVVMMPVDQAGIATVNRKKPA